MDSQRFDDITRALAAGATRRRVLKGLTGSVVGALAGALGIRRAGANPPQKHCKFEGYNCRNNTNCCSNNCCNRTCCGNGQDCCGGQCYNACPAGQFRDDTCACVVDSGGPPTGCPPGTTDCAGTCVDLSSDEANCGACGEPCPRNAVCVSGACICPAGTTNCAQGEGGCCLPGESCSSFLGGCCANNAVACDAETPCCSSFDNCGGPAAPGVCCRPAASSCSSTTACCNGPCNIPAGQSFGLCP